MIIIKAQSFSFMEKMVPKVLSGEKYLTNRTASKFRGKLDVGGIMHLCTGSRTPNYEKLGDAIVLERVKWFMDEVPLYNYHAEKRASPIKKFKWLKFSQIDGFEDWYDFVDYFMYHKNRELGFYCFLFELTEEK